MVLILLHSVCKSSPNRLAVTGTCSEHRAANSLLRFGLIASLHEMGQINKGMSQNCRNFHIGFYEFGGVHLIAIFPLKELIGGINFRALCFCQVLLNITSCRSLRLLNLSRFDQISELTRGTIVLGCHTDTGRTCLKHLLLLSFNKSFCLEKQNESFRIKKEAFRARTSYYRI